MVFVEVKSWSRLAFDELETAINARKQRRITGCARAFIGRNPRYTDHYVRFDVILVRPGDQSVEHIEGAFEEECLE